MAPFLLGHRVSRLCRTFAFVRQNPDVKTLLQKFVLIRDV